ncbi:MAG: aminoglycoside adenylyltransferase domain-containing protein [Chloroflexota bacterium]
MAESKKSAAIPESVCWVMDDYMTFMQDDLPGFLSGLYIQGSIALGAFSPGQSDIDFIAVISRRATPDDIAHLKIVHEKVMTLYPTLPLEGSYVQPSDLGKLKPEFQLSPYIHDDELTAEGDFDINRVTWWILKNRGITLLGTDARDLDFTVDWDALAADTLKNLNDYWARYADNPTRILWLLSDFGIQWTVLGVLRQYYTFKERSIISKIGAGDYALQHLPSEWHRLIQEAVNIRRQGYDSLYPLGILRALDAYRFLKWIIGECNTQFG